MGEDFSKYNGDQTELRKAQLRLLEILVEFDRICKKHDIDYFISGGTCLGAVRHGGFIPWDDDIDVDVPYEDYNRINEVLKKELPPKYFLQTPKTEKGYYHIFSRIVDLESKVYYSPGYVGRNKLQNIGLFLDIFPIQRGVSNRLKKIIDKYYVTLFRYKRGIGGTTKKKVISMILWPVANVCVTCLNYISSSRFNVFVDDKLISHIYGTNITPIIKYANIFPTKPILFEGKWLSGPAKPEAYLKDLYGDYMAVPPPEKRVTHSEKIVIE